MPPADRLAAIQERFYRLVTAPEGVGPALAAQGQGPGDLESMVVSDARLGAVARLDVYANMYFFRILDVLRDAYPKLVAAVGDAAFHDLITDYLLACPPAHPSIAFVGERLPGFLAGHPLAAARPWLTPLAWLERAHTELFDGPDPAGTLTLDDVRALPPPELMGLPLALVPCHRILAHPFALDPFWRALDGTASPPDPEPRPERLLVWRQEVDVFHRVIDDDEGALLAEAAGGTTLQALCERVSAGATEAEAAQRAFHLLGRWLEDGLLVA